MTSPCAPLHAAAAAACNPVKATHWTQACCIYACLTCQTSSWSKPFVGGVATAELFHEECPYVNRHCRDQIFFCGLHISCLLLHFRAVHINAADTTAERHSQFYEYCVVLGRWRRILPGSRKQWGHTWTCTINRYVFKCLVGKESRSWFYDLALLRCATHIKQTRTHI